MGAVIDTSLLIDLLGVGLLKSLLIVGMAGVLTAGVLRTASASVRHWVWTVAVVSLLGLPLVASLVPSWDVPAIREPLERIWRLTQPAPATEPAPTVMAVAEVAGPVGTGGMTPAMYGTGEALPVLPPVGGSSGSGARPYVLLGVWLLGGALLLLRPILGMVQVRRWTRAAMGDPGAVAPAAAGATVRQAGLMRTVTVRRSPRVAGPLTWGLVRPVILLPVEAASWPAERLRAVLLHELAHIRRWDYLTHLLGQIARAIYWFNPLVWWAVQRMHHEQEQACDDAVLQAGTPSEAYATHLLEIARALKRPALPATGSIGMARHAALKQRIRAILAPRADRRPLTWAAGLSTTLAMAAFVGSVASLQGPVTPEQRQMQRLLVTLREGDVPARQQAALRLGRLGDARAIGPLLLALRDRAEPVSVSAGLALQQFDDPRVRQALASGPTDPGRPDAVAPDAVAPDAVAPERPVYLWMEAEHGELTAPMQRFETAQASGGAYVEVPNGPGHDDGGEGAVRFAFEVPVAGRYAFWGRVLGLNNNDNSLFVSVDGGTEVVWDTPEQHVTTDRWVWDPISDRDWSSPEAPPEPLVLTLEAGRHTLTLRNREDGTRLDRVLVTNDLTFVPSGHGSVGRPLHPIHVWLEAEDGLLSEPLLVKEDPGATGGQFIEVGTGHNSRETPPETGRAIYPFTVLEAGTYQLWGRVQAPDGSGDSFWVRVDGERWVPWNGIVQSETWSWVPVYHQEEVQQPMHFNLTAGPHTLEVAYREDDTKLDRLLITNDVSFTPSGRGPAARPVEVIFRTAP
ncbi:hypothetical protein AWN76_002545 [Rhodothermaceae bacterium RA]|nr:hypothetical protein AWN76_002545 [Rhodothermaceae bacterium RA]